MSNDMIKDIHEMHKKYGVHDWVQKQFIDRNDANLKEFLQFRMDFVQEEFIETLKAVAEGDSEEVVDGLIDIIVVALGTLDAFSVDSQKAWDEVLKANLAKEVGVKPERPNPLGLPDLIKPEGWTAPSHDGNHGHLPDVIQKHI